MAELCDGAGMAEAGAAIPPAVGVVSGHDPRTGVDYVNQVFLGMTGGAAGPHADAWLTIGHVGNAGLCCIDGVELDELYHPIIVHSRALVTDSEGAGRHTGAPAIEVRFGPLVAPMEVGYVSDGHDNPPLGVRGGGTGGAADQWLERSDKTTIPLAACAQVLVHPGETIVSIGAGGGGYGAPGARDPALVAAAVREGLVSRQRAALVYRVALDEGGAVDVTATAKLRHA
jgi:N-methylhydantoinase B